MGRIYKYEHDHRMKLTCGVSKVCMHGFIWDEIQSNIGIHLENVIIIIRHFPQTFF